MTTRRPLSSPATPATRPVVQTRWAASVVATRCGGCAGPVEAGVRFREVRSWSPGEVRPRVVAVCERCVEGARSGDSWWVAG